jgi:hypothetical protein
MIVIALSPKLTEWRSLTFTAIRVAQYLAMPQKRALRAPEPDRQKGLWASGPATVGALQYASAIFGA